MKKKLPFTVNNLGVVPNLLPDSLCHPYLGRSHRVTSWHFDQSSPSTGKICSTNLRRAWTYTEVYCTVLPLHVDFIVDNGHCPVADGVGVGVEVEVGLVV